MNNIKKRLCVFLKLLMYIVCLLGTTSSCGLIHIYYHSKTSQQQDVTVLMFMAVKELLGEC